jgi:hypothetical protein
MGLLALPNNALSQLHWGMPQVRRAQEAVINSRPFTENLVKVRVPTKSRLSGFSIRPLIHGTLIYGLL